jgi:hypothetical protein
VGDAFVGVVKHRHLWVELRISPQHMIQNTNVGVAEFLRSVRNARPEPRAPARRLQALVRRARGG